VEQQFGEVEGAFRTLDLYTSAMLEASLAPAKEPKEEWRVALNKMSEVREVWMMRLAKRACSAS
jgi:phosphoenolpyruvate carboxylase